MDEADEVAADIIAAETALRAKRKAEEEYVKNELQLTKCVFMILEYSKSKWKYSKSKP